MTSEKIAYERLKQANPHPVVHIKPRPHPVEIMTNARNQIPVLKPSMREPGRDSRIGPLVGALVFVLVFALGLPMLLDNQTKPLPDSASPRGPTVTSVGVLGPGTHRVGTIGVPVTFDLSFQWWVERIDPGRILLADPVTGVEGTGARRQLTLVRPTALADPSDLSGGVPAEGGWALDDIDGWLNRVEQGVSVSEVSPTTVSGYPAMRFVVRLDDAYPCGPRTCASLLSSRGSGELELSRGTDWLVWWVDLGPDVEPLALVAATSGNEGFRRTLDEIVGSIVLGEPQPHPIQTDRVWELGYNSVVPEGEVEVPAAGGVRFVLPSEQYVFQNEHGFWIHVTELTLFDMFIARWTTEGESLDTVEDVAVYLESRDDLVATDAGTGAIGPYDGRVYDVTDGPLSTEAALWVLGESQDSVIPPPTFGRIWIADTERGPLVMLAGTLEGDLGLAGIVDFAEQIRPTVELVDLDWEN